MNSPTSGHLLKLSRRGAQVAEILLTNRGITDGPAVDALLAALDAPEPLAGGALGDVALDVGFVTDHLVTTECIDDVGRFVAPVHVFYDTEADAADTALLRLALRNAAAGRSTLFPEPYTGGVVTEADLVDREAELDKLWADLRQGSNIVLTAPRRFGKTSLMRAVQSALPAGWRGAFVDLESVSSLVELIARVDVALSSPAAVGPSPNNDELDVAERVQQTMERIRQDETEGRAAALRLAAGDGRPFALLLDEATYMLENVGTREAGACLGFLEELSRTGDSLRMVLAASTDLRAWLSVHRMSLALPRAVDWALPPFSEDAARTLVLALFARAGRRPGRPFVDAVLSLATPPIPFFLQVLAFEIQAELRRRDRPLTADTVHHVYRHRVVGPDCRRWFDAFDWHLSRYYTGEEGRAARVVLGELARREAGIPIDQARSVLALHGIRCGDLDGLLRRLAFDVYVSVDGDHVRMENRMLRDYWRRFHVPAGD